MKRFGLSALLVGLGLFCVGCGNSHTEKVVGHDLERAAHDLTHDAKTVGHDAAKVGEGWTAARPQQIVVPTNVHTPVFDEREPLHEEVLQAHHEAIEIQQNQPAELREEVKEDTIDAAGAEAKRLTEKLFKK